MCISYCAGAGGAGGAADALLRRLLAHAPGPLEAEE